MLKWLITLVIAIVVLSIATPWLSRYGLGRLPGDIAFRFRGRNYYLPITTTVLLSLALSLISRFV